ncbi:MAG: hypothetical protein IJ215_04525 [Clostridia bacterium]|nr:hypothetical protein [Clostridia bacterium]
MEYTTISNLPAELQESLLFQVQVIREKGFFWQIVPLCLFLGSKNDMPNVHSSLFVVTKKAYQDALDCLQKYHHIWKDVRLAEKIEASRTPTELVMLMMTQELDYSNCEDYEVREQISKKVLKQEFYLFQRELGGEYYSIQAYVQCENAVVKNFLHTKYCIADVRSIAQECFGSDIKFAPNMHGTTFYNPTSIMMIEH